MRVDMGGQQPKEAASRQITGDTQFMFQFYKPCFQFYEPNHMAAISMSEQKLQRSLVAALQGSPLLFGRFKIHGDQSITLDYDPADSNNPTIEFQSVSSISYADLARQGFAYSLAKEHGLDMPIPNGTITMSFDLPMLMVKVSYLSDGGVAFFGMTNHVAFDGNAMFSFIAHWAKCNRRMAHQLFQPIELPLDLQPHAALSLENSDTEVAEDGGPVEISVDATRTPAEITTAISRVVKPQDICACVFSISVDNLARLKQEVVESSVLGEGEWISSNNALAAFVAQRVAWANTEGQCYEIGPWTIFQSLDMRRPLNLPLRGLGSPVILAECQATHSELVDRGTFPLLSKRVRRCIDRYTGDYLRNAVAWVNASYKRLGQNGVHEPWRHFWFTALNTNSRAVGISCMNRIPIYDADFGAGRPRMARSFNPRPNYVIVFPGPPIRADASLEYGVLHLYVTLERLAMDVLQADPEWTRMCTLVSEF
ncbi:hypothetical protein GGF46_001227 [Coemansia sp. RSA 552]|nr:hypothetical protein GGF46_001227 [Coemansia sp. RSA 552]